MIKLYTSLLILLGFNIWAILMGASLTSFINLPGLVLVLVPGLLTETMMHKNCMLQSINFFFGFGPEPEF